MKVPRTRSASDGHVVHRWMLDGHGIGCKAALDESQNLQSGRLVALGTDGQTESAPLLLCPQRREISPLITALRGFLRQRCAQAGSDSVQL